MFNFLKNLSDNRQKAIFANNNAKIKHKTKGSYSISKFLKDRCTCTNTRKKGTRKKPLIKCLRCNRIVKDKK